MFSIMEPGTAEEACFILYNYSKIRQSKTVQKQTSPFLLGKIKALAGTLTLAKSSAETRSKLPLSCHGLCSPLEEGEGAAMPAAHLAEPRVARTSRGEAPHLGWGLHPLPKAGSSRLPGS